MGLHLFTWVSAIPGLSRYSHLVHALLVMVILLVLTQLAVARIRRRNADIVPERTITVASLFDLIVETIEGMLVDTIGHQGRRYLPLIGTLGLFIFTSNMLGLIPGFLPPTDNLNVTAACAITVFLSYHFFGIREHGLKYFKHFTGPMPLLAPIMVPIEIIGHLARPLSLSLRLMGNMMGDHLALTLFVVMVPLLVPLPIMALGVFVAIVQTLVFVLLSMVYIAGAVAHEEH